MTALRWPALSLLAAALVAALPVTARAQATAEDEPVTKLETVRVTGNWLGSGLQNSAKTFPGARTVMTREALERTGASAIGDVLRQIPGVQATENSGNAGTPMSINIGIRGLTGRYSPRSTILLDGIPLAVAPYGQPQLSFAPISLNNIETIDVVRGGGAVRYGPQNVGGIVNFRTKAVPTGDTLTGDASIRYDAFGSGQSGTQTSAFLGSQLGRGFGFAVLHSAQRDGAWRRDSGSSLSDTALKLRYDISPAQSLEAKLSYFDVKSQTPGGLTVAQFNADPYQNTRPTDFWSGRRKGFDVDYVNTFTPDTELEVRAFHNESFRQSALINAARTQLASQPRYYFVSGFEPRVTHRFATGPAVHDVTAGYRFIRERGHDDRYNTNLATGANSPLLSNANATDAQSFYVDDRIAIGQWRITPGVRYENIDTQRSDLGNGDVYVSKNRKWLPSLSAAYLLTRDWTLFANYGTSFGPVQNTQMNSQTAANPLIPELAKTKEIGARFRNRQWRAEATVFNLQFDNQIQQVPGTNPPIFRNIGATKHHGVETAVQYAFADDSALRGLSLYANYAYTKALQDSGAFQGLDVPFYSRHTDTLGAHYGIRGFAFDLSSTHQSRQFSDIENTAAENAAADTGIVPGFRTVNAQVSWKQPALRGVDVTVGVNNLTDRLYYTRNVDANAGRLVGAPRTWYIQTRYSF